MYFSKSFVTAALLGLGSATTHMGEMPMGGLATSSTSAFAASETLASAPAAEATGGASAGEIPTHVVQVGGANGSLVFSPDNIKAAVGDLVQFQFYAKNHSVVQSTFDQPCVPIQNVMPNMTSAFYSGFMPTTATIGATSNVLTYTIRVSDTKPIWYYCAQAKHCQGGMVGAINAAESGNKTIAAFKALAAGATENLSPGQGSGSGSTSGNGTGTSSGGSTESSSGAESGSGSGSSGSGSTGTTSGTPAQQTTNAAPSTFGSQSFFSLALGGIAAVLLL